MAEQPVEGLDPEELEEQGAALEEMIAAALAATAAAAVAQVFIPGMPGLPSVDGLGIITDLWWPHVDNDLLPELGKLTIRSAEALAAGINHIRPRALPAVNVIPDVTAAQILAGAQNRLVAIGGDLWANARASMVQGLEQGETIPELAARVRAAAGVTEPRARTIARTEVIGASNQASIAQARSAGYDMTKIWHATEDPRTRLWHREADGQEVPLNGMFQVGGELLDIPGDPRGRADNVINCRCGVRYGIDFGEPVVASGPMGALHRPGLNCCRGQDGLPVHKGPCRGAAKKATPAKADRPSVKERASERAFDQMVKSALPNRGRERRLAEPKPVDAAVARQAQIDAVRPKADLLAELEETAIINQADPEVTGRTVAAAVKRLGLGDDPDVARLMPAVTSGDPEQIATAIADAASRLGLRRIGGDGGRSLQVVPFDRQTHEIVGDPLRPGQFAEVVRPGWWIDLPGETPKVLTRARVTETDARPPASPGEAFDERSGAAVGNPDSEAPVVSAARSDETLREYWVHGEGALKIRWPQDGAFDRCVRQLSEYADGGTAFDPEGLCAEYYHEANGRWPGAKKDTIITAADRTYVRDNEGQFAKTPGQVVGSLESMAEQMSKLLSSFDDDERSEAMDLIDRLNELATAHGERKDEEVTRFLDTSDGEVKVLPRVEEDDRSVEVTFADGSSFSLEAGEAAKIQAAIDRAADAFDVSEPSDEPLYREQVFPNLDIEVSNNDGNFMVSLIGSGPLGRISATMEDDGDATAGPVEFMHALGEVLEELEGDDAGPVTAAADRDYVRDGEGQFASLPGSGVVAAGDKLKLGKKATDGASVVSSRKARTSRYTKKDLLVAEVETPQGAETRVGVFSTEGRGGWDGGFQDDATQQKIAELRIEADRLRSEDELGNQEALEALEALEEQISELGGDDDEGNRTVALSPAQVSAFSRQLTDALGVAEQNKKKQDDVDAQLDQLSAKRQALLSGTGAEAIQREIDQESSYLRGNERSIAEMAKGDHPAWWDAETVAELIESHRATVVEREQKIASLEAQRAELIEPAKLAEVNALSAQMDALTSDDITDMLTSGEVAGPNGTRLAFETWGTDDAEEGWNFTQVAVLSPGMTFGDASDSSETADFRGAKGIKDLIKALSPATPTTAAAYPEPVVFEPGELWHAIAHTEGVSTGHRVWLPGAISWRQPPFALHWEYSTAAHGGQMMTVQVGLVTRMERIGDQIHAWGNIDLGATDGAEVGRKLAAGFARWVSMGPGIEGEGRPGTIVYDTVYPAHLTPEEWGTAQPEQVVFREFPIGELTIVSVPAQEGADIGPSPELLALMGLGDEMTSYNDLVVAGGSMPHDPLLCTCMGDDGLPPHSGPCRGSKRGGGKASAPRASSAGKGKTPAQARERLANAEKMFGSDRSKWTDKQRRDAEALDKVAAEETPAERARRGADRARGRTDPTPADRQAAQSLIDDFEEVGSGQFAVSPRAVRGLRDGLGDLTPAGLDIVAQEYGATRSGSKEQVIESVLDKTVNRLLRRQERDPAGDRQRRAANRAREAGQPVRPRFSRDTVLDRDGRPEITTAGGSWVVEIPDLPEAWMFEKPDIAPGTPPTITDDGRFFGYFAPAKTAHRSYARMGVRKEVKTLANTDYSRFLRNVPVAGGGTALAGPITMECMHAPTQNYGTLDRRHQAYEDTCSIVARANIGEDADGGRWFAGVLEPGLTAAQLRKLTVSQLSLDSQPHPDQPGMQDFVAILVVPTPGWPTSTRIDSSQVAHTIRETEDGMVVTASCAPIVFTPAPAGPPPVDPSVVLFFAQQVGLDPVSQIQAAARVLEGV